MFTQFLQTIALIIAGLALVVAGAWVAIGSFAASSMFNQIKERFANVTTSVMGLIGLCIIALGVHLIKIS